MLLDKKMEQPDKSQNITALLHEWKQGKKDAFDKLFPFVYDELRRRASSLFAK